MAGTKRRLVRGRDGTSNVRRNNSVAGVHEDSVAAPRNANVEGAADGEASRSGGDQRSTTSVVPNRISTRSVEERIRQRAAASAGEQSDDGSGVQQEGVAGNSSVDENSESGSDTSNDGTQGPGGQGGTQGQGGRGGGEMGETGQGGQGGQAVQNNEHNAANDNATVASQQESSMLQSYFDSVTRTGTTRGIEEEKEMVADKLTEVFKLVKFLDSDDDLCFGGNICKYVLQEMEVPPPFQMVYWEQMKKTVRKNLDSRRSNCGNAIKRGIISKW